MDDRIEKGSHNANKNGKNLWSRISPEKINVHNKLSPESLKAMLRLVDLTGMTQSSIIEMALVALLVGMTNNPYYEDLIKPDELRNQIKDRYPKNWSKFTFDVVRDRALRGRTPIQRAWLKTYVPKDEVYREVDVAKNNEE